MRQVSALNEYVETVLTGIDSKNTVRQDAEARDEGQVSRNGEGAKQGQVMKKAITTTLNVALRPKQQLESLSVSRTAWIIRLIGVGLCVIVLNTLTDQYLYVNPSEHASLTGKGRSLVLGSSASESGYSFH